MEPSFTITTTLTDPGVDLTGKRVLITGASRGVGAAAAVIAARAGADVAINYRSKLKRAEAVAADVRALGRTAVTVEGDLTDEASLQAMFAAAAEGLGGLDVVVLNASGGLEKDAPADYGMKLNRDAQVRAAEHALDAMGPGGTLVFVTSHLAHYYGQKSVPASYEVVAKSKHAGEQALRAMQGTFDERGVRFAVVSGDLIDGTITPKLLERLQPGMIEARREEAGWLPTTEDFAASIVLAAGKPDLPSGVTVYVGSTEWSVF